MTTYVPIVRIQATDRDELWAKPNTPPATRVDAAHAPKKYYGQIRMSAVKLDSNVEVWYFLQYVSNTA